MHGAPHELRQKLFPKQARGIGIVVHAEHQLVRRHVNPQDAVHRPCLGVRQAMIWLYTKPGLEWAKIVMLSTDT